MVPTAAVFPYTTLFRSLAALPVIPERAALAATLLADRAALAVTAATVGRLMAAARLVAMAGLEEQTAELQSLRQVVCRVLLEKKKTAATGRSAARSAAL